MKPNDKAYQEAADAAQFQNNDYAGLVEELRDASHCHQCVASGEKAADALEALLAERDALKAENESMKQSLPLWAHKQMAANNEVIERLRTERDALLARLAPVDDEALEAKVAAAIIAVEHNGIDDEFILEARAAIAAIRPHIEAAEREQCVTAVEKVAERINVPLHERPAYEDGYLQGVHDAAAAIRRGK